MKRIAFITDTHLDEEAPPGVNTDPWENLHRVLADLSARGIRDIVFGGDIGEPGSHPAFFAALQSYSVNLVLGNHDRFSAVKQHYRQKEAREELYYSYEEGRYRYVFLDSSSGEVSPTQLAWLARELKESKRVLLFLHHPLLPIDTPVDRLYPLTNREAVKELLLASNKEVTLFCGHYHLNDERSERNIRQYTTPSLCYQTVKVARELAFDDAGFGYRIIHAGEEGVQAELIAFDRIGE